MANFIPTEMFQMLVWNSSFVPWTVTGWQSVACNYDIFIKQVK